MRFALYKKSCLTASLLVVIIVSTVAVTGQNSPSSRRRADVARTDGGIRIGLASPRVTLIGGSGNALNEGKALRRTLSGYLTGPRIGTVDLDARLDSLAMEEGQERQCDFVLYTSLKRKRPTGKSSVAASFGKTKTDEEFTFEYKLMSFDGTQTVAADTSSARVTFDGEDVLTPIIEGTAQAIVSVARKMKPVATSAPAVEPIVDPSTIVANQESPQRATGGYDLLMPSSPRGSVPTVSDPPKAEGAIRIGLVIPRVSFVGGGPRKDSPALNDSVKSYLIGSTIETIDLNARLDSLALAEARKRACDYVLYTSLIWKRQGSNSNSSGAFSNIMGGLGGTGLGGKVPGGKKAQTVTKNASSVAGTLASFAREKDEVTFEYTLVAPGSSRPTLTNISKAKVKSDGEDVLTPMIETAAQAIVDVTKKN